MNDLEQIEITIESAKKKIQTMEALNRLMDNKDFQRIIDEGYLKEEPVRLVYLKAAPEMQEDLMQKQVISAIDGIGQLRAYLSLLMTQGYSALRALEADEKTREEILAEQLEA